MKGKTKGLFLNIHNNNLNVNLFFFVHSGLSDKYDPFVSAKRQLEDLFSPTIELTTSTPIRTIPATKSSPLSTSLNLKSPQNPSQTLNANKSNFRRTSSLRVPKRAPVPLAYTTNKYKPTIQRGISDEGPISSNFMKPEEYDELPVKSHAIITPDLVPRSPSRELVHRSPPREIVRRSSSRDSNSRSPSRDLSTVIVKRDQKSSQNRRNLRLDIKNPNNPSDYHPLAKTDSLAAFLMYENDLSCSPDEDENSNGKDNLSEKEVIDKNHLNKETLSRNLFADLLDSKIESGQSPKTPESQPDIILSPKHHSQAIRLSPIVKFAKSAPPFRTHQHSTIDTIDTVLLGERTNFDDNTINLQLINSHDKLKINTYPKLSDSMSTSSYESHETTKPISALNKSIENIVANQFSTLQRINSEGSTVSGICGIEKRSLKRQLKLNKDNFLYDNTSGGTDGVVTINRSSFGDDLDGRGKGSTILPPLEPINFLPELVKQPAAASKEGRGSDIASIEALFDDFDFEEFISSFEDDEQYPIFKNYKELMNNRSAGNLNKYGSGGSSDGESTSEEKSNGHDEHENTQDISQLNHSSHRESIPTRSEEFKITSSMSHESDILKRKNIFDDILDNKTIQLTAPNESKLTTPERDCEPTTPKKIELPAADDGMSQAEKELLNSVHELNQMCESNSAFQLDSGDELSSMENLSFTRSVGSKLSADSAYGRLVFT